MLCGRQIKKAGQVQADNSASSSTLKPSLEPFGSGFRRELWPVKRASRPTVPDRAAARGIGL
jgi:hypothetical protein